MKSKLTQHPAVAARWAAFCYRLLLVVVATSLFAVSAHAAITGVISGTITDQTGAVIPQVTVTAVNDATGVSHTTVTDAKGFYSFPTLDVGNYTVNVTQSGFQSYKKTAIHIDANSSIRTDIALALGSVTQIETVTSDMVQVETQSTQVGEVIDSAKIQAVPLNGRAFTDLLSLQPGVSPYQGTSESASEGGKTVSGGLNAGNMSINGGREASNGYMVNGIDVNDGVQNGTAIVPNLDSLSEFRIITNNFDAEYGNFSGGQVNVVTKNGTNNLHGSAFEFYRGTALNARNYFLPADSPNAAFNQNIYGGTIGGTIKKDKIFFFADFQGTNQSVGAVGSPSQTASPADLTGNVLDLASNLSGQVIGGGWADVLTKRLGYGVTEGENYYSAGCTSNSTCVFPNAVIPKSAWDPTVSGMLKYIPAANTTLNGLPAFLGTNPTTLKDFKESARVDVTTRLGTLFGYYFLDNYNQISPYGGGTDGQFPTSNTGRAQLANLGLTTTFNNNAVNTFRFGYMRSAWHYAQPSYTAGPSLASQGFVTPWGPAGGISPINPGLEGVPQISINTLSFGTPGAIDGHYDNTFQWLDSYLKVVGTHTIQFGGSYHYDQIDERNFDGPNGVFNFSDGNETGAGFADFLLGADSGNFTQSSIQILDNRGYYLGAYVQDAWRARPSLTINYGLRYEIITPWWDTANKIETIVPGLQSKVFPGAPVGWVFPGDPGVPKTLAPVKHNKFAPRFGFAYAPTNSSSGFLSKIEGGPGKFSVRGGAGLFYTNFQEESGYEEAGDAPFGNFYQAPLPTMMFNPYVDRDTQNIELQKFPAAFPPSNTSPSNPDNNFDWAAAEPLSSSFGVRTTNTLPYTMNYFLGIQRELGKSTVFSANYVGNQGRHLGNAEEANPGDAALCLSLSKKANVAAGTPTCGPKLETQLYTRANGALVQGTRPILGLAFGSNPYLETRATSNYNSLQTSLKHTSGHWDILASYTYAKSLDNSSGITDSINPFNPKATYGLSKTDVKHYFVTSYNIHPELDRLVTNRVAKSVIGGWAITGITKMATGVPITMSDNEDYSLTGSSGVDFPYFTAGNLFAGGTHGDRNPRNNKPFFNTSLFTRESRQFADKTLGYGQPGNSKRRFFYGPGLDTTDLAVLRDFHIHEAQVLQLRVEAFNVFNHTQFLAPSGSATSASFGVVTSAAAARVLQLAAKYHF